MAKKNKAKKTKEGSGEVDVGEQLDLIDVQPETAKPIIRAAKLYKKYQIERLTALAKEKKQKQQVLELVKTAKLQPLDKGKIKFKYGGVTVSITPRDELVQIKDEAELE